MNTDDNEKKLAQAAMRKPGDTAKSATSFVNRFGRIAAPVKRVKGYDQNAERAARKRASRAKLHNKRMRQALHRLHAKAPIA